MEIADILEPNRNWYSKLDRILKLYEDIYGFTKINRSEKVSKSFFNYCLRGKYFVVTCLYNSRGEMFIQRDFSKRGGGWELVGGWLKNGETFDQAVDRIVEKETGNKLVEAIPVSLVRNAYYAEDDQWVNHYGLVMLGRLRNDSIESQNGVFSPIPEKFLSGSDAKIVEICRKLLSHKVIQPPVEEVDSFSGLGLIKNFHSSIVKPVSYFGSSRILKQEIMKRVLFSKEKRSFLDVACGDDDLILDLTKKFELVVANDISRDAMFSLIESEAPTNLIFSNQNLLELEFKIKFDVVLCKNVLHHMRNSAEIKSVMRLLGKLGKKIILMDVENPRLSWLSRIWNDYYVNFLNDQGGFFLSFDQFKQILQICFGSAQSLKMEEIVTIKGKYMVATIDL